MSTFYDEIVKLREQMDEKINIIKSVPLLWEIAKIKGWFMRLKNKLIIPVK